MEHELLSLSSDSWTDAQQPNPCTPVVTQDVAEHVCLPADGENWEDKEFADPVDPIEDFSGGYGKWKYGGCWKISRDPRMTVDFAALFDRAADKFSACMDTKVDSMMDRLEKRIDQKNDYELGLVMDRLSALEKIKHQQHDKWPFFIV